MECSTFEELLVACESSEFPESLRKHVSDEACGACAGRLASVRRLLELLPSLALESPPVNVLAKALKTPARARRTLSFILEAVLPAPQATTPAFRSSASAASGRRLYRKGSYELDLALGEDGALMGELLCDAEGPERSREGECMLYGEGVVEHAELDSEGCFRFERLGSGAYVLVIESDDVVLVVPDLQI